MARIRSIKPDFWTDPAIGSLARDHRLLLIAIKNEADDQGRLRWDARYLKGAAFRYDDDVTHADVEAAMQALVRARLIAPYRGPRGEELAVVVDFLSEQKVNRPTPSRLPPPPQITEGSVSLHGALNEASRPEGEEEEGRESDSVVVVARAREVPTDDPRWLAIAKHVRREVGDDAYASWFAGKAQIVGLDETVLTLGFPTPPLRELVRRNHRDDVLTAARKTYAGLKRVEIVDAPPAPLVSTEAQNFAAELAVICGHDPGFLPPSWVSDGPGMRVQQFLNRGFSIEMMRPLAQAIVAGKRDGPPATVGYFAKPFARAHEQQSSAQREMPLVSVVKSRSKETPHETDNQRSAVAAARRLRERVNSS